MNLAYATADDVVAGDPAAAAALAEGWSRLGILAGQTVFGVERFDAGLWEGHAADAFRDRLQRVVPALREWRTKAIR